MQVRSLHFAPFIPFLHPFLEAEPKAGLLRVRLPLSRGDDLSSRRALTPQVGGTAAATTTGAAATSVSLATRRTRAHAPRASRRWTTPTVPKVSFLNAWGGKINLKPAVARYVELRDVLDVF